jgi:WD40 repeat protein/tetratricopeptide (TPR) repeat protein
VNSSHILRGHRDSVYDLCWSPLGDRIASCGRDGVVSIWSVEGAPERSLELSAVVYAVRFSSDGETLVVATKTGRVVSFSVAGDEPRWDVSLPSAETLAVSPDGAWVVVGGGYGLLWVLDSRTGRVDRTLSFGDDRIRTISFSPTGDLVAVGGSPGLVLFATASWSEALRVTLDPGGQIPIDACVFAPDGRSCATAVHVARGGPVGTTENPDLYEIALWRPLDERPDPSQTLLGHVSWIKGLAFSPSGDLLVSGAFDESVRLWDPEFHTALGESREHEGAVYSIAFAPDGRTFASCSADMTVRLWNVEAARDAKEARRTASDFEYLSDLVLGLLAPPDRTVGRDPLLIAAQRIADDLLGFSSDEQVLRGVERLVDYVFTMGAISLGRAVTQTLAVRGEHARRSRDQATGVRCARLSALLAQRIGLQWATEFTHRQPARDAQGARSEPPPEEESVRPSAGGLNLAPVIDAVANDRLKPLDGARAAARLEPTPRDLMLSLQTLERDFWPEVVAGRRQAGPVLSAAALLADLAEPWNDELLLCMANSLLGRLLCVSGDNQAGLQRLESALAISRRLDAPELLQAVAGDLANACRNVGRLREARRLYQEAAALARSGSHHTDLVHHLANLSIVESDLGNRVAEHELLSEARMLAEKHELRHESALIADRLGVFFYERGDYAGADKMYQEALDAAAKLNDKRLHASVLGNHARARAAAGQPDAEDLYVQALGEARMVADAGYESFALDGLAELARQRGDIARASSLAEEAVDAAERSRRPRRQMRALARLAAMRAATTSLEALDLLERSVHIGEGLRGEIKRSVEGPTIQSELASIYDQLVVLQANRGHAREAFEASERGRAALLVRSLEGDAPEYRPRPMADILGALEDVGRHAVLVSYHVVDEELIVFVLRAGEDIALERRPIERGFLAAVHDDYDREIRSSEGHGIGETWLRLGTLVIDPIVRYLRTDDLLLFAPHRQLHNLPLHALSVDGRRVLERWPSAYLPSASALPHLMSDPNGPPSSPRVIGAHFVEEAQLVAATLGVEGGLIGSEVEVTGALDALTAADFAHISAHGFFSGRDPEFSGWILRPSEALAAYLDLHAKPLWQRSADETRSMAASREWAESSVLSASDIEGRRVAPRLTVASACDSGVVATDAADDPSGLVPALIRAGVRGVIATLWLVDAETTRLAMAGLYGVLSQQPGAWGHLASALQDAALEVKRKHDHPFFWAPYVLIGGLTRGEAI